MQHLSDKARAEAALKMERVQSELRESVRCPGMSNQLFASGLRCLPSCVARPPFSPAGVAF
jgi:hypothetical protein